MTSLLPRGSTYTAVQMHELVYPDRRKTELSGLNALHQLVSSASLGGIECNRVTYINGPDVSWLLEYKFYSIYKTVGPNQKLATNISAFRTPPLAVSSKLERYMIAIPREKSGVHNGSRWKSRRVQLFNGFLQKHSNRGRGRPRIGSRSSMGNGFWALRVVSRQ